MPVAYQPIAGANGPLDAVLGVGVLLVFIGALVHAVFSLRGPQRASSPLRAALAVGSTRVLRRTSTNREAPGEVRASALRPADPGSVPQASPARRATSVADQATATAFHRVGQDAHLPAPTLGYQRQGERNVGSHSIGLLQRAAEPRDRLIHALHQGVGASRANSSRHLAVASR